MRLAHSATLRRWHQYNARHWPLQAPCLGTAFPITDRVDPFDISWAERLDSLIGFAQEITQHVVTQAFTAADELYQAFRRRQPPTQPRYPIPLVLIRTGGPPSGPITPDASAIPA